jgi:succinate-semialdehyde dehydrogenase/glutarate-semialdehyde dehydrogenase
MALAQTLFPTPPAAWIAATPVTGREIEVINPAHGYFLAAYPALSAGQIRQALDQAAQTAQALPPPAPERRAWLLEIARLLESASEDCARLITLENGKPLAEARAEVAYARGFFLHFARVLEHFPFERQVAAAPGPLSWNVHLRPAGVAALITPWNFPLAMLAKKLSAALAAGCVCVVKPSSRTPLSADALLRLARQAGVPPVRLHLLTGKAGEIGRHLAESPHVRVLSLTGSTEAGRTLVGQSTGFLKRLALELGGNAPFLVFEDADLDAAADALVANKLRACGQTCVCTNRVLVPPALAGSLAAKLRERCAPLKTGDGLVDGTDLGPLIGREALKKAWDLVEDALRQGAVRVFGEDPLIPHTRDWGCWMGPQILTGITPGMRIWREEIFGPVFALGTFATEDEAVALANGTPHGLAAYAFTRDPARQSRLAAALRFGHLGLNTGQGPSPEAPFGGMKESGFGREGGEEGLLEYLEPQTVASSR